MRSQLYPWNLHRIWRDITRFGETLAEPNVILTNSKKIRWKSGENITEISPLKCRILADFQISNSNRIDRPALNVWSAWSDQPYQSATGWNSDHPIWSGRFWVRHKPDPDRLVDKPSQSCGYSVWWVFGPSRYGVVGFDSGLILFYGFDSHHGYGCSVWWVFSWWFCGFCGWRWWWWILWVLFPMEGVGFFHSGGDGFFCSGGGGGFLVAEVEVMGGWKREAVRKR